MKALSKRAVVPARCGDRDHKLHRFHCFFLHSGLGARPALVIDHLTLLLLLQTDVAPMILQLTRPFMRSLTAPMAAVTRSHARSKGVPARERSGAIPRRDEKANPLANVFQYHGLMALFVICLTVWAV